MAEEKCPPFILGKSTKIFSKGGHKTNEIMAYL
jgi:hypothetical protein